MDSLRQYSYCIMVWSQWFYPCGNNCNLNSDLLSKRHVFSCKKKSLIFGLQTCQKETVISVCLTLIKGLHSVSLTFIMNLENQNEIKKMTLKEFPQWKISDIREIINFKKKNSSKFLLSSSSSSSFIIIE